jgi:Na+/glutamate symporter
VFYKEDDNGFGSKRSNFPREKHLGFNSYESLAFAPATMGLVFACVFQSLATEMQSVRGKLSQDFFIKLNNLNKTMSRGIQFLFI